MSIFRNPMLRPTLSTINTPGALNVEKVISVSKKTITVSTATPLGPDASKYSLLFSMGNSEIDKDVEWVFTSGNRNTEYTSLVATTTDFAGGLSNKPFVVPGYTIINPKTGAAITSPDGIMLQNVTSISKVNDSEGYKIMFTFNPLYARGKFMYWTFAGTTNRDLTYTELTVVVAGMAIEDESITTGITAFATGGQTSATALTTAYNNVTVVATAGDSVKLLAASGGLAQTIKNNGASNLAVFPASGDTIDGGSANASITMAPGTTRTFTAINTTDWESNQAITSSSNTFTSTTGITAHAGGGQGSAVALTTAFNNITVCATAGDSVVLPTAVAALLVEVENNGATAADVFPATGGAINGGSANVAIRLAPGARKYFIAISTTAWLTATKSAQGKGTVAAPAFTFDDQPNMGMYWISATQLGFAVGGVLKAVVDANGVTTAVLSELVSGAGVSVVGNLLTADTQTLTGAGAVNVTSKNTLLVTTGANALTLAAGSEGQSKFIRMKTDGGDGTLTVTNLQGGTTITFNDAGDFVQLYYVDAKWHIIVNSGTTVA